MKEFNKVLQIVSIRLYKHDQYSGKTNEFKLSNQKKKKESKLKREKTVLGGTCQQNLNCSILSLSEVCFVLLNSDHKRQFS